MEWKKEGKTRIVEGIGFDVRGVARARECGSLVQNGSFETATCWVRNREVYCFRVQPKGFVGIEKRFLLPR